MGRAKYVVELAEEERVRLRSLLRGGRLRMVTRARVLLKADEGYTDGAIASTATVAALCPFVSSLWGSCVPCY